MIFLSRYPGYLFALVICKGKQRMLPFLTCFVISIVSNNAVADYTGHAIFSVEWLVHESDTIALVVNEDGGRVVIHTFKGTGGIPAELVVARDSDFGRSITGPWSSARSSRINTKPSATVSLLFLQEARILQDVLLTRGTTLKASLRDHFFGVTETGKFISSEAELMHAVDTALKEDRGRTITRLRRSPYKANSGVVAPSWFPLETSSDFHIIITKFDETWRDRLIAMAQEGTAAERIWALRQLSWNDDKKSVDALKRTAARLPDDVIPSSGARDQEPLGAADVQRVAQKRLDWLRSDRTGYPEL